MMKSINHSIVIDPYLAAINWLRNRKGNKLVTCKINDNNFMEKLLEAAESGKMFLVENIGEIIDEKLLPFIQNRRNTIDFGKKKKIRMTNSKEIEIHNEFHLILQTRLFHPHYSSVIQSNCSIINFIITEDDIEEKLLNLTLKFQRYEGKKHLKEFFCQSFYSYNSIFHWLSLSSDAE